MFAKCTILQVHDSVLPTVFNAILPNFLLTYSFPNFWLSRFRFFFWLSPSVSFWLSSLKISWTILFVFIAGYLILVDFLTTQKTRETLRRDNAIARTVSKNTWWNKRLWNLFHQSYYRKNFLTSFPERLWNIWMLRSWMFYDC